ncbi:MAG: SRPBCC family protein [Acidimicrobiales bacterium]
MTIGSDYQFVTEWRVAGTLGEVKDILGDVDPRAVARWWPSVYLWVEEVERGGEGGLGRVLDLHTKGWLPYTLRWTLRVTEPLSDAGYALEATGDLEGTGRWTFQQDGPEVLITYDWRIHATKPLLRRLGWLLRPAFAANHHWAMARGEESLRLELRRRRQGTERPVVQIPPSPPPTFRWLGGRS